mmetsp:Transcript_4844/g.6418  ORF Transcript_4844/g.6418 Transcript_4844/m.6418 type:complete len:210 (-) Transcript_4844:670-1299(-)
MSDSKKATASKVKAATTWLAGLSEEQIVKLLENGSLQAETILQAFEQSQNEKIPTLSEPTCSATTSFLQFRANDDVMLRILDYVDPSGLANFCCACLRFAALAKSEVDRKVHGSLFSHMRSTGLLQAKMKLEQEGKFISLSPTLLPFMFSGLEKPVWVHNSGQPGVDGTYVCHKISPYGFEFKKVLSREYLDSEALRNFNRRNILEQSR